MPKLKELSPNLALDREKHEELGECFNLYASQPTTGKCFEVDEFGRLHLKLSKATARKLALEILKSDPPRRKDV